MRKDIFKVRPVTGYSAGYPRNKIRRRLALIRKPILLFNLFTVAFIFMLVSCGQDDSATYPAVKVVSQSQIADISDTDNLLSDNIELQETDEIFDTDIKNDSGNTDADNAEENSDYDDYWMTQLGGAPPANSGCSCSIVE